MSQKSEKYARRMETGMETLCRQQAEFGKQMEHLEWQTWQTRLLLDDSQHRKLRQELRDTKTAVKRWKMITGILVLALAMLAVRADAAETGEEPILTDTPIQTVRFLPAAPVDEVDEVGELDENARIEAALLANAQVIENCVVTHYDCCVQCCGKADGITATGIRANPGVTVAVDPTVIPLGSDVLVDYGDGELHYYRAEDVGGSVKGNHIDLCVDSHAQATELGKRAATVYWIPPEEVN